MSERLPGFGAADGHRPAGRPGLPFHSVSVIDRSLPVRPLVARMAAGIRFPVVVFAVWRVLQASVVLLSGGSLRGVNYTWDGTWYLYLLRHGYTISPGGYDQES